MEMPRLFAPALIVALAIGAVSEAGAQGTDGLAERWSSYRDFWFRHDSVRLDASDAGASAGSKRSSAPASRYSTRVRAFGVECCLTHRSEPQTERQCTVRSCSAEIAQRRARHAGRLLPGGNVNETRN
jgi:hypothetical protein